ncbi:hypothetical protein R3P38DRAFT_3149334 [Favolaschia claudopus]|uniref:Gag-like protein n=1 Tax=Favolaschia claudopus TaxID=2862362 RepID=A0AAV9Z1W6_9AGAR
MQRRRPGPAPSQRQVPAHSPKTGDRRPRSPDPFLAPKEGEQSPHSITKSPHTDRVIKRGRTTDDATPARAISPTPPFLEVPADWQDILRINPKCSQGYTALDKMRIAVQALALAKRYHDDNSLLPKYMPHILQAFRELRNLIEPEEQRPSAPPPRLVIPDPPTPSPPTNALATKAAPEQAPTAKQPSKPKHPAAPVKRSAAKPQQRTSPSTRLIVDLTGISPTKTPHPESLCKALNSNLDGRLAVTAVNTTRNGNLILHASAPACSADTLAGRRALIWTTLMPLLGITDPAEPPMYPADPWHKVVFHQVPLPESGTLPSPRDFIREIARRNQLPGTQYRIGNVRFLHRQDKVPQGKSSVRVDFMDEADARRFLRNGMFLFGSHCQASRYKPRVTSSGRPPGGPPPAK